MNIDNLFSATKALISNDTAPLGKKSKNRGTQMNKKVWNAKNMVMMIKLEPKRRRTEKQNAIMFNKHLEYVNMCKWWKLCSKKWSTKLFLLGVFSNRN